MWRSMYSIAMCCVVVQIERFVKHKLDVCRWVGLAVLIMQLLSLGLAYALSAAQQKLLDVRCYSDALQLEHILQHAQFLGMRHHPPWQRIECHIQRGVKMSFVCSDDDDDEVWGRRRPLLSR